MPKEVGVWKWGKPGIWVPQPPDSTPDNAVFEAFTNTDYVRLSMKLSYRNIRTELHVKVKITEFIFLEREGEVYYNLEEFIKASRRD